jgi:ATP-dependent DNA helicase RecG
MGTSHHPKKLSVADKVTVLRGVGPNLADKLKQLGIASIQDLLFHLPLRYEDRTRLVPLADIRPGQQVAIEARVEQCQVVMARKRSLICHVSDGRHILMLRFFYFSKSQQQGFKPGQRIRCFGQVRLGRKGLEMIHPEYRLLSDEHVSNMEETLTAIYPTTEGLQQASWRKLMQQALTILIQSPQLSEYLPSDLLNELGYSADIKQALLYIHRPPPDADLKQLLEAKHPYQQRLAFEELLAHHLSLRKLRQKAKHYDAVALTPQHTLTQRLIEQLPFHLTEAQQRVSQEIQQDLTQAHPMLRLVQGDVGSGKTIVAALALLVAIENNYQAALMAPTELLAEQHYQNFQRWLSPLGIDIVYLSSSLTAKQKRSVLEDITMGKAQLIIGTHALFQQAVQFKNLCLLVVDEQHRFGVHQRLALKEKGIYQQYHPHQLIMTATPIPRTLAMSAYADLDVSIIDELPPGRQPVETVVIANNRRQQVIDKIREAAQSGRQIYWVCTLIEESEALQAQAAEAMMQQLQQALPEIDIALVHGRMKSTEKDAVMTAFKQQQFQLLVATTVIEVGVDVANASLMIIENAERLGLSQLHQLRGRVGRGNETSHCILLYQAPLSESAKTRLNTMRQTNDGFKIAEEDLKLRGPGEVLGKRQTGMVQMRIANLLRDRPMLPKVQQTAQILLAQYPEVTQHIIRRWLPQLAEQYARV